MASVFHFVTSLRRDDSGTPSDANVGRGHAPTLLRGFVNNKTKTIFSFVDITCITSTFRPEKFSQNDFPILLSKWILDPSTDMRFFYYLIFLFIQKTPIGLRPR